MIAKVTVDYTFDLIDQAWREDEVNVQSLSEKINSIFHHPFYRRTEVQKRMYRTVALWWKTLSLQEKRKTRAALSVEGRKPFGKAHHHDSKEEEDIEEEPVSFKRQRRESIV